MRLDKNQKDGLGKYLLDISKLVTGIFVFTSVDKPVYLLLGFAAAALFLATGLHYLKGEKS